MEFITLLRETPVYMDLKKDDDRALKIQLNSSLNKIMKTEGDYDGSV